MSKAIGFKVLDKTGRSLHGDNLYWPPPGQQIESIYPGLELTARPFHYVQAVDNQIWYARGETIFSETETEVTCGRARLIEPYEPKWLRAFRNFVLNETATIRFFHFTEPARDDWIITDRIGTIHPFTTLASAVGEALRKSPYRRVAAVAAPVVRNNIHNGLEASDSSFLRKHDLVAMQESYAILAYSYGTSIFICGETGIDSNTVKTILRCWDVLKRGHVLIGQRKGTPIVLAPPRL